MYDFKWTSCYILVTIGAFIHDIISGVFEKGFETDLERNKTFFWMVVNFVSLMCSPNFYKEERGSVMLFNLLICFTLWVTQN